MKTKFTSLLFLFLFSLFCVGCTFNNAQILPEPGTVNPDGTITVRLYLGADVDQRSVLIPSFTLANLNDELGVTILKLYIDKDTASEETKYFSYNEGTTNSIDVNILPGTHTLKLDALKDDGTVVLQTENQSVEISTTTPNVKLKLKPFIDTNQKGSAEVIVEFPKLSSGAETFYVKAQIDAEGSAPTEKQTVNLDTTSAVEKTFTIQDLIPGEHHINFTVSKDENFAGGNATISYTVFIYSNMTSKVWSENTGTTSNKISFTLSQMEAITNIDVAVCVVGTGGAFTTSSTEEEILGAFETQGITCKRVARYDASHGGVMNALSYCEEVHASDTADWIIYIVGKLEANSLCVTTNGLVDIGTAPYNGKNIKFIGFTGNTTDILDGNTSYRVVNIGTAANVTFDNITIQNGKVTGTNNYGGGIKKQSVSGNLTIQNCIIQNNTSEKASGGGLYINISGGTNTITNTTFYKNSAANSGGGLYIDNSNIVLTGCTIEDNSAGNSGSNKNGGGMLVTAQLSNNVIVEDFFFIQASPYCYTGGRVAFPP